METLVVILFILVCFSFVLKQTFVRPLQMGITAMAAWLFTGLAWRGAILQSSTQIAGWLTNTELVRDISVLLNLDVLLAMAFCLLATDMEISGQVGRRAHWLLVFLRFFPGIMVVPAMFGILVKVIFAFPGEDFSLVAWTLGGVFAVAIPLLTHTLKRLLPETFLRLELLFLSSLLIALMGIVATVNGKTTVTGTDSVDLESLVGTLVLIATSIVAGMAWYRWRTKQQIIQMNRKKQTDIKQ